MYEEEKKNSFIKDLIIKLLYFFLFLFLFMWLYPAPKVDLDDVKVNVDKEALDPLYKQIFNNNIASMKNAGKSYFTTDRLPSKTGDKVKITLKEMLNKKLLLEFTDEEGNSCSEDESYIEVTKSTDSEYNMKVYLSCNNKKDYVNEIIGCTNVCPTGACTNVITNPAGNGSGNGTKTTTNKGGNSTSKSPSKNTTTYVPVPGKNTTTTVYVPTNNNDNNNNNNNNNNTKPNNRYVTVYFDPQGGSSVNPQTMLPGNTAYEPVSTRNEYTFKCWSTVPKDNSCSKRYDFNTPVYNDKTLYAQWQKNNNNNIEYEYIKTTWEPDYTWTTEYKTGSNIKRINTKTTIDDEYRTRSYTYRTISWFRGYDTTWNYGLWLNNIPANAENVRIKSYPAKFSSRSEIQNYKNNRFTCVIQMVGYNCPSAGDYAIIGNDELFDHSVGSFGFNTSSVYKSGSKYRINFNLHNNNVNGDTYQYLAPIKFTVSWDEPSYNKITKYQYAYKQTKTRYSTSNHDQNLLNDGYKLTGRTR